MNLINETYYSRKIMNNSLWLIFGKLLFEKVMTQILHNVWNEERRREEKK